EREIARLGLEAACKGCAVANGIEGNFDWLGGYPALVNDPAATAVASDAAIAVLGKESVVAMTVPSMGGEDFSYYLQRVPGAFWFLNSHNPDKGIIYPNHHPRFNIDEDVLDTMIAVNLAAAEALAQSIR
ncbi:MAG TPA: M20/M25/M40 family metallo-hydrolase, partial [Spirochaetales bacterium]|nr:M20/M25/M40 family metallo-hydrolase [Spirochaetales bacterium]